MRRENWIKWDLDSRTGFRMASFFALHGSNGYGFFIVLIEQLYRAENYKLPYKLIQKNTNLFKITEDDTKLYLDSLIELGLFSTDENQEFIWSDRVIEESKDRSDHAGEVSEVRRNAVNKRWANKKIQTDTNGIQNDTNEYKGIPDQIRSDQIRSDNKKKAQAPLIIPEWVLNDPRSSNAIVEWIDYRRDKKAKLLQSTLDAQLKKFNTPERLSDAIGNSIEKGWTGLFEPDKQKNKSNNVATNGYGANHLKNLEMIAKLEADEAIENA